MLCSASFTLAQLNTAVPDAYIAPIASPTFTGTLTAPTIVSTTVVRLKNYTVATLPAEHKEIWLLRLIYRRRLISTAVGVEL